MRSSHPIPPSRTAAPVRLRKLPPIALAAISMAVAPALAGDGVLEINHACAARTGCFPGDAPGYPVTIGGDAGHSYRLTSDLVVPGTGTDGIVVSAPDTSIDLNGFAIARAGCLNATTDCTASIGRGSGISVSIGNATTVYGVAVRNGAIIGMGRHGVLLGPQAEVRNLRARWNRDDGIVTGISSTVSNNIVYQNGDDGIFADVGSTVSGNTAYDNSDDGLEAGAGSTVRGNTAFKNGGDGIETLPGCNVQGNTARGNGGFGLRLGFQSAYRGNVIHLNAAGSVTGGVDLGANSCNGTASCP